MDKMVEVVISGSLLEVVSCLTTELVVVGWEETPVPIGVAVIRLAIESQSHDGMSGRPTGNGSAGEESSGSNGVTHLD